MLDLKNVLIINALSSGLTGIGLIALNKPVASFMGTHNSDAIIGVGIFLFFLHYWFSGRVGGHCVNQKMCELLLYLM